jgi:hemolysin III
LKEPFCGVSHLTGAVLSVGALAALMIAAAGRPWHVIGFGIFGMSLILLYLASGLYHTLRVPPAEETRLQRLDHAAIFLLIAGTYAPVCLVSLHGIWGWSLLAVEYALCIAGVVGSVKRRPISDWTRIILYLVMAYVALVALGPLHAALTGAGLAWLLAGGAVYTVGTVIFGLDKPHLWPGRFSAHDLWHVFVLAGSACHFVMMLRFVAPDAVGG